MTMDAASATLSPTAITLGHQVLLQTLRQSANSIGRLLAPLLLLSWLSVFCGNCLALGSVSDTSPDIQHDAQTSMHDCCDDGEPVTCASPLCQHGVDDQILVNVYSEQNIPQPQWMAVLSAFEVLQPVILSELQPPYSSPSDRELSPATPAYLRHCVFLI